MSNQDREAKIQRGMKIYEETKKSQSMAKSMVKEEKRKEDWYIIPNHKLFQENIDEYC